MGFEQLVLDIIVAGVAVERGLTLGGYGAEFDYERVAGVLEMCDAVAVAACAVEVLAAAAGVAACET